MKDLLDFMPVYYIDVKKDKTIKMNKQLKKRVKRQIVENKKKRKKND